MKSLSKSVATAAGLTGLMLATFTMSPVFADSPGQIEGGPIYRIENVTQKATTFTNPASAGTCDQLEYSVRLHNSGFGEVTNIVVSAPLAAGSATTNTSNVKVTYGGGVATSTTASATLNLSSAQTVSYQSGTTEVLDSNGNLIKTIKSDDGIASTGVNVGDLAGSTTEYVNFEAKVNCPTPPTPPATPTPTPATPTTPSTPAAPTTLVNTGPGSVVALFAVVTVAGAAAYRFVLGRRLSRQ